MIDLDNYPVVILSNAINEETKDHLQQVQLMILKDFIEICDKYDLNYYLFYGTLIGAVRHKGFIPWDDDIDVIMFRDEYEKLIEVLKHEMTDKYEILEPRYQNDYFLLFAKMCLKDTKYDEYWVKHVEFNLGIFIDIFVLDNVPDNKYKRFLYKKYCWALDKLLTMNVVKIIKPYPLYMRALSNSMNTLLTTLRVNPKHLRKKAQKVFRKYEHDDTEYVCDLTEDSQFILKREDLEPPIKVPFEDIEAKIPRNYDYILKLIYGDYMRIPTEDERVTHVVHDLDFGDY